VPEDDDVQCLLHCDFGPHNVLVHNEQVAGILDWESVRIGDPAEDISTFLQSCGGKIGFNQAMEWYEENTGRRISEYRLRYFDVFRNLHLMTACASAASMVDHLDNAAVEWCNFPLRWYTHSTGVIEEKIALAEKVRTLS
jgi:aminoglycoside phosphotransferase (APT) family kinase protein